MQIKIAADKNTIVPVPALAEHVADDDEIEDADNKPPDCFSQSNYKKITKFLCCCFPALRDDNSPLMVKWTKLRQISFKIAENKNFELFIIIMIVLSSIALVIIIIIKLVLNFI